MEIYCILKYKIFFLNTYQTDLVDFLKAIGAELIKVDASTTEMMFEAIIITELVDIILACPNKREDISQIIFSYCSMNCVSRHRFLKKIKEKLSHNLKTFISILSIVVSFDYEDDFTEELYNMYFYYAMLALDFPSPITRTQGLKILSEIVYISFNPVIQILGKFDNLAKDTWWELRALIIIVCSSLLLYISREKEAPSPKLFSPRNKIDENNISGDRLDDGENPIIQEKNEENQNEDLQDIAKMSEELRSRNYDAEEKFLLELIRDLFTEGSNQNILKIGKIMMIDY